jgi:hypothetical protein
VKPRALHFWIAKPRRLMLRSGSLIVCANAVMRIRHCTSAGVEVASIVENPNICRDSAKKVDGDMSKLLS